MDPSNTVKQSNNKRLLCISKINIFDHDKGTYSPLDCKESVKYLGISIDKYLNWKTHLDLIALKISKTIGIIARLRHFVPLSVTTKLYQSLIYPYLTYGISSWSQASQSNLQKLLLLQKRALRLMNFSNQSEHAIPCFLDLNILPVNFLYVESIASLMYDVHNNLAPDHIRQLFKHVSDVHSYNTRSATTNKFYVLPSRADQQKNSFSRLGVRVWNALPENITKLKTNNLFKKRLHELLINILKPENSYPSIASIISKIKNI